jgi:hypothetical protein
MVEDLTFLPLQCFLDDVEMFDHGDPTAEQIARFLKKRENDTQSHEKDPGIYPYVRLPRNFREIRDQPGMTPYQAKSACRRLAFNNPF